LEGQVSLLDVSLAHGCSASASVRRRAWLRLGRLPL